LGDDLNRNRIIPLHEEVMTHPLSRKFCRPVSGQKFIVTNVEYVLCGKLGDGAAALVRRARRLQDGTDLAIKFLAPDPKYIDEAVFDDVAARFRREGQRAQQLSHESLVQIHAYDDNQNGAAFLDAYPKNPFILMEEVKGSTLESYIRREERRRIEKNLPRVFILTPERLSIAVHVVQALQYLHKRKLVHRDVKPANIFLPATSASGVQPRAKLGDFGIMKWGDFQASVSSGTLTVTSQRGLGTLKYMSPEQALAPKDVTVRSDIFSLGITLFELFSGQILPSPHHVFEVQNARLMRGTTPSRLMALGCEIAQEDIGIAELVLEMHLRGASHRPAIEKIAGRLMWEWERRTDEEW
jgi:eukaryotic-like serine/threonine-protein kinase